MLVVGESGAGNLPGKGGSMGLGSIAAIVAERVLEPVEGMHRAIAQRWVRPPWSEQGAVERLHGTTLGLVYGSIRLGVAAVGVGLDHATSGDAGRFAPATAVVNGLWGDDLGRHTRSLGIDMSLRDSQGALIAPDDLHRCYPRAARRLAILVHGFAQTESCWASTDNERGLHEVLGDDPLTTPILVRYNTGVRVNDSGEHLAHLVEGLVAAWPVPVEAVSLIGFSMGGLVCRRVVELGFLESHDWIDRVSDLVVIATPHEGTPIEKSVNLASIGFQRFSVTEPLGRFLDGRSSGIQDMRHGLDSPTVFPDHVRLHVAAATITHDPRHPIGFVAGDLVIRESSARAMRGEEPKNTLVVGGVNHASVHRNRATVDSIVDWLGA